MKVLINCSNHPSENWSKEQKEGFKEIVDVAFPQIDPSEEDILDISNDLSKKLLIIIRELQKSPDDVYLYVAGEQAVTTTTLILVVQEDLERLFHVVTPTTQRNVSYLPSREKVAKFEFGLWRDIPLFCLLN